MSRYSYRKKTARLRHWDEEIGASFFVNVPFFQVFEKKKHVLTLGGEERSVQLLLEFLNKIPTADAQKIVEALAVVPPKSLAPIHYQPQMSG